MHDNKHCVTVIWSSDTVVLISNFIAMPPEWQSESISKNNNNNKVKYLVTHMNTVRLKFVRRKDRTALSMMTSFTMLLNPGWIKSMRR
jgi:hypothetical protein